MSTAWCECWAGISRNPGSTSWSSDWLAQGTSGRTRLDPGQGSGRGNDLGFPVLPDIVWNKIIHVCSMLSCHCFFVIGAMYKVFWANPWTYGAVGEHHFWKRKMSANITALVNGRDIKFIDVENCSQCLGLILFGINKNMICCEMPVL